MGKLSLRSLDGEENGLRNGLVEEFEDIRMEFLSLELKMEDLDFWNLGSGRNADGFWGQLGMPEDLLNLMGEEFLQPCRRESPFQNLILGNGSIDDTAGWEFEHL
jgi:hypothetical protein